MHKKLAFFLVPVTGCYMLAGIAVLDEILIFSIGLFVFLYRSEIKLPPLFNPLNLFLYIAFISSIIGTLFIATKSGRLVMLFGSLILLHQFIPKIMYSKGSHRALFYGILLICAIQVYLTGIFPHKTIDESVWAFQGTFWAGTAFTSYYISAGIVLAIFLARQHSENKFDQLFLALLIVSLFTSVGMDSRFGILMTTILGGLFILRSFFHNLTSLSKNGSVNALMAIVFLGVGMIIFAFILFDTLELQRGLVINELTEDRAQTNMGRKASGLADIDRIAFLLSGFFYIQDNFFQALFPMGTYSHQIILIDYYAYGADPARGGLVRPTGVPAFFVDYGLIANIALFYWFVSRAFGALFSQNKLFEKILLFILISYSGLALIVVNLQDALLFYLILIFVESLKQNSYQFVREH